MNECHVNEYIIQFSSNPCRVSRPSPIVSLRQTQCGGAGALRPVGGSGAAAGRTGAAAGAGRPIAARLAAGPAADSAGRTAAGRRPPPAGRPRCSPGTHGRDALRTGRPDDRVAPVPAAVSGQTPYERHICSRRCCIPVLGPARRPHGRPVSSRP